MYVSHHLSKYFSATLSGMTCSQSQTDHNRSQPSHERVDSSVVNSRCKISFSVGWKIMNTDFRNFWQFHNVWQILVRSVLNFCLTKFGQKKYFPHCICRHWGGGDWTHYFPLPPFAGQILNDGIILCTVARWSKKIFGGDLKHLSVIITDSFIKYLKWMHNGGIPSALNEYEDKWWMQNYIWKVPALHIKGCLFTFA
jgi:hypothetical protein